MAKSPNILIVDYNTEVRDALKRYLERNAMRAAIADSGASMDRLMAEHDFDLIILDAMMPGEDGLAICKRIRATAKIPIIMMSAIAEDTDRIVGLELGADDYISKPFNPREVLARVKAILRRAEPILPSHGGLYNGKSLRFGKWILNIDQRQLQDESQEHIILTSTDFQLLLAFLERPRTVLSRDRLLEAVSGRTSGPFDRAIDNQVSRLRRKIERDPGRPELIMTVRGGGYSLVCDVTAET